MDPEKEIQRCKNYLNGLGLVNLPFDLKKNLRIEISLYIRELEMQIDPPPGGSGLFDFR